MATAGAGKIRINQRFRRLNQTKNDDGPEYQANVDVQGIHSFAKLCVQAMLHAEGYTPPLSGDAAGLGVGFRLLLCVAPASSCAALCSVAVTTGDFPPLRWEVVASKKENKPLSLTVVPGYDDYNRCSGVHGTWIHEDWMYPAEVFPERRDVRTPLFAKIAAVFIYLREEKSIMESQAGLAAGLLLTHGTHGSWGKNSSVEGATTDGGAAATGGTHVTSTLLPIVPTPGQTALAAASHGRKSTKTATSSGSPGSVGVAPLAPPPPPPGPTRRWKFAGYSYGGCVASACVLLMPVTLVDALVTFGSPPAFTHPHGLFPFPYTHVQHLLDMTPHLYNLAQMPRNIARLRGLGYIFPRPPNMYELYRESAMVRHANARRADPAANAAGGVRELYLHAQNHIAVLHPSLAQLAGVGRVSTAGGALIGGGAAQRSNHPTYNMPKLVIDNQLAPYDVRNQVTTLTLIDFLLPLRVLLKKPCSELPQLSPALGAETLGMLVSQQGEVNSRRIILEVAARTTNYGSSGPLTDKNITAEMQTHVELAVLQYPRLCAILRDPPPGTPLVSLPTAIHPGSPAEPLPLATLSNAALAASTTQLYPVAQATLHCGVHSNAAAYLLDHATFLEQCGDSVSSIEGYLRQLRNFVPGWDFAAVAESLYYRWCDASALRPWIALTFVTGLSALFHMTPLPKKAPLSRQLSTASVTSTLTTAVPSLESIVCNSADAFHYSWTVGVISTLHGVGKSTLVRQITAENLQSKFAPDHPQPNNNNTKVATTDASSPAGGGGAAGGGRVSPTTAVTASPKRAPVDADGFVGRLLSRVRDNVMRLKWAVPADVPLPGPQAAAVPPPPTTAVASPTKAGAAGGSKSAAAPTATATVAVPAATSSAADASASSPPAAASPQPAAAATNAMLLKLNVVEIHFDGSPASRAMASTCAQLLWLVQDPFSLEHTLRHADFSIPAQHCLLYAPRRHALSGRETPPPPGLDITFPLSTFFGRRSTTGLFVASLRLRPHVTSMSELAAAIAPIVGLQRQLVQWMAPLVQGVIDPYLLPHEVDMGDLLLRNPHVVKRAADNATRRDADDLESMERRIARARRRKAAALRHSTAAISVTLGSSGMGDSGHAMVLDDDEDN